MKRILLFFVAICLFFPTTNIWAMNAPNIKEGLWEITLSPQKSEASGFMKEMLAGMPDQVDKQCLTKKDFIPNTQQQQPDIECKTLNQTITKNRVTWAAECDSQMGKSTSKGSISYNKTSLNGTIDVENMMMNLSMEITGKYLGKCD